MIIYDLMGQPFTLYLGRQGEKDARTLTFDLSCMKKKFGQGTLALAMKSPAGGDPFPVAVDVSGDTATWTVSNVETDTPGEGEAQFTYTVNGVIKKTVIYKTKVDASLTPLSETAPDPFDNWLDELTQIGGQIVIDKAEALDDIADARSEALTDISGAKTEAVGDIQAAGTNAVNAVLSARTSALEDLSTATTETLSDVSEAREGAVSTIRTEAEAASGYAEQAEQSASAAQASEQAASQYAEEARSYAENLHFTESSPGNIIISVGGGN